MPTAAPAPRTLRSRLPRVLRALVMAPGTAPTPADPVLARNLHLTTIHGVFNSAAINMVAPFTAIFAMRIGATKLHVALLTSAPAVISLLTMIPGAGAIDRSSRKKRLTALFTLAARMFYLLLACVPFLPGPGRPSVFVLLLALMNLPGAVSNVAWQAFLSRVVPPAHRAGTIAARNRVMNLVGTGLTLGVGLFLDRAVFPVGYQIAFVAAFLMTLAELAVFRQIREPIEGSGAMSHRPIGQEIRAVLKERRFVRYTLVSMLFYLAWQIPWPLYSWYQVRVLGANNTWVSILALLNTGGALVGYGFWSRLINRWGNLKALFAATLPIFVTSLAYAFSTRLLTIAISNLVVGAIFSGVNIALFSTLLEMTPEDRKTTYIAWFNTAVTVSSIVAPLFGVALLSWMDFRPAFLVTAAVRLAGALCYYALYRVELHERRTG